MATKEKKLEVPTVLAFRRNLDASDAYLYQSNSEKTTLRRLSLKKNLFAAPFPIDKKIL